MKTLQTENFEVGIHDDLKHGWFEHNQLGDVCIATLVVDYPYSSGLHCTATGGTMRRYDQTAPDVVYFNPKTDGEQLIKSKHTLVTWDGVGQFKAFYADDYRFFDQFTIPCVTTDQAQEIAEEYAAEFDLACDEETDDD